MLCSETVIKRHQRSQTLFAAVLNADQNILLVVLHACDDSMSDHCHRKAHSSVLHQSGKIIAHQSKVNIMGGLFVVHSGQTFDSPLFLCNLKVLPVF